MPQWLDQLDDEPVVDGSVPINGVNATLPPSAVPSNLASRAINRLAALDDLNRPRPGVIAKFSAGAGFDSIHHLGNGVFLYNNGPNWGRYDSRSNINTGGLSGGPAFLNGDQIYSALADKVLYFSRGDSLYKYSVSGGFGTNSIPSQYPAANYPIWAVNRLFYAYQNNILVSDILDPEVWDITNQSVTLDPIASDEITGMCLWQNETIAVFRNGSTWIVNTGPQLLVVDWEVARASATVGCCAHGTIVQCGVDVFFLSETGRGVYALSQVPTSTQLGVWQPISAPVKPYIDRINWSAVACARATYWNDLYLLSVPLDGATYNNFVLVFSVTLNSWQGMWCFDYPFNDNGNDYGFRDSARDRTSPDNTLLLLGTIDGQVAQVTYPALLQYNDIDVYYKQFPIESSLISRSFTFGEDLNQIQPHSMRLQFLESEDDVTVTVVLDRTIQPLKAVSQTSGALLQLTIPSLPFDLDQTGYYNLPLSLLSVGVCSELQVEIVGDGNWTLFQIKAAAFTAAPMEVI